MSRRYDEDDVAPCIGEPYLFESDAWIHHLLARQICAECPLHLFEKCRAEGEKAEWNDGTWAGQLYVNGKLRRKGRVRERRRAS